MALFSLDLSHFWVIVGNSCILLIFHSLNWAVAVIVGVFFERPDLYRSQETCTFLFWSKKTHTQKSYLNRTGRYCNGYEAWRLHKALLKHLQKFSQPMHLVWCVCTKSHANFRHFGGQNVCSNSSTVVCWRPRFVWCMWLHDCGKVNEAPRVVTFVRKENMRSLNTCTKSRIQIIDAQQYTQC